MKRIYTLLFFLGAFTAGLQVRAADAHVNISDFAYTPAQVTIMQGESVTWHWVTGVHPTRSDSNPAAWATFTLEATNPTFSHVFNTPGTYPYHCQMHGVSMSGSIVVLASPTGTKEEQGRTSALNIYPNPAKDFLKISINQTAGANYEVRITNVIGKTLKTVSNAEIKVKAGNEIVLNVSDLPAGLYFVSLWNKDRIIETRRQIVF